MLEVKHVSKTFNPGTVNEKKALDDISLRLEDGDFVTVVGGNGAGKSTLLNMIAGVYPIDCGHIVLNDKEISTDPEYKRARFIGRVFQDPLMGTAPHLTVAENVSLALGRSTRGASLRRAMRKEKRDLIASRLETLGFGLEDRMDVPVGTLSGGQRQAVTLLMATIGNPELLLLDEHTAALDPAATERILELTDRIVAEQNVATLMITHDLKDALAHGDRTLVMHDGRIVADVLGSERDAMDVDGLLELFRTSAGSELADDKVLLKA